MLKIGALLLVIMISLDSETNKVIVKDTVYLIVQSKAELLTKLVQVDNGQLGKIFQDQQLHLTVLLVDTNTTRNL